MTKCPYHVYNLYTLLIYQLYYTPRKLSWHFIQSINHWSLKNIHNFLSDLDDSFLLFSLYFSCMVAITAAMLAGTLVYGLQHNETHVPKINF